MTKIFNEIATTITKWSGSVWASLLAILTITLWVTGGFLNGFTDSYQIIIGTITTIITFIMVFLIQNSQNRDNRALQLKLDELIRSKEHADNNLINIESLSDEELDHLHQRYLEIAEELKNRKV